MSGVYIPGMKMPKTCSGCVLERWENGYGNYCVICPLPYENANDQIEYRDTGRMPWCPLVPVPEHGDLIDKSGVDVLSWTEDPEKDFADGVLFVLDKLDELPVIIPAEEGE